LPAVDSAVPLLEDEPLAPSELTGGGALDVDGVLLPDDDDALGEGEDELAGAAAGAAAAGVDMDSPGDY
jgi:hypothetical protein